MQSWDYAYGFMDAYSYVCVASGKLDLSVNLLDKALGIVPLLPVGVTEAGGRFTDIRGLSSVHQGSIVLSNNLLHEQILDYFR